MLERKRKSALLGKILLNRKTITREQLNQALLIQKEVCPDKALGQILVNLGYMSTDELHTVLGLQFQYPHIKITQYKITKEVLSLIPKEVVKRYKVIPLDKFDTILTLAMFNPLDRKAIKEVTEITGLDVRVFVAGRKDLDEAIGLVYR